MTRHTARRRACREDLVDELSMGAAQRLRVERQSVHAVVNAVVDYLLAEYPAQELYIPAMEKPPAYPVERIRRAIKEGRSMRWICREFRVDRRTVYRLLDAADPDAE